MEDKQMKNLLSTRCIVNDKICGLVIDRKYRINMVSTTMVEKLGLSVLEHPEPYILYSLEDPEFEDMADVLVTTQVRVSFTRGKYKDEVLCDVVPSKTRDLLLGLPWHQQRRSKHDRQIVIVPKENDQDQILKRKSEKNVNVESFVNEKKKKEIIIEKIESKIKEVERKEKERKYTYEEV